MITSIHIKNIASYDQQNAEILNDLKKINFIYGSNGSGKTTISNFLSGTDPEKFQDCNVVWSHLAPLKTLVYNKNFREDNFGDGKIAGVFTLGKATKDETNEIDGKKSQLSELNSEIGRKKETLKKQNEQKQTEKENYEEDRWNNVYLKYKDEFKEAFKGFIGSKKNFSQKLQEVCDFEYNKKDLLTIEAIREKAKIIFGKEPIRIEPFVFPDFDTIVKNEKDPIWQTVIIGKSDIDIAGLINQLGANDWVDEGRKYIGKTNTCPFCQQETITDDFREKLESFFDDSFKKKKESVSTNKHQYENLFSNQLESLKNLLSVEKVNAETKLDCNLFETLLKTLESQFLENKEHINNKLEHVSNVYELRSTEFTWNEIKQCIEKANKKISEHNRIVKEFASETQKLKKDIWFFVAEESQSAHKAHGKKVDGLKKGINAIKKYITEKEIEAKSLDSEIKALNLGLRVVEHA